MMNEAGPIGGGRNEGALSLVMKSGSDAAPQDLRPRAVAAVQDQILVTGANGFIGSWVVRALLARGFRKIRCLTRGSSDKIASLREEFSTGDLDVLQGNLLSPETCARATRDVTVVYHLAAGVEKTFPGCFLNSAVTTRNLLAACLLSGRVRRFVNISSLAVYSNRGLLRGGVVDETCEIENQLAERYDPYAYGKAKQDEIVREYGSSHHIPYVIVRPGITFGPGKTKIPGRVGIDTFGIFLHLGLGNRIPLTYVENCADAIVLAGLVPEIDGQEINVVDDNLPSSRAFLRQYKRRVRPIGTIPVPYRVFYLFNYAWERYSAWSDGQLPPVFNRKTCEAYYRSQTFSNGKAKALLGWRPRVPMDQALERYCEYAHERLVKV
jgi:nucleoside-diphosphate-sugar epimerase